MSAKSWKMLFMLIGLKILESRPLTLVNELFDVGDK